MPVKRILKICQYCKEYSHDWPASLSRHEQCCEKNPKKQNKNLGKDKVSVDDSVKVVAKVMTRKRPRETEHLLAIVQLAFPKGIPTVNIDLLEDDMNWIAKTGEILSRR